VLGDARFFDAELAIGGAADSARLVASQRDGRAAQWAALDDESW
jgi:hypothetical protein